MPIETITESQYLVKPIVVARKLNAHSTVTPHRHSNFYEIDFINSGGGYAKINETDIDISPGDIFFATPLDVHSYVMTHGDIHLYSLEFSEATILPEYQNILFNTQIRYAHFDDTTTVTDIFEFMLKESEKKDHFSGNNMNFCVNMILSEFIRASNYETAPKDTHPIILDIVRYVRIHATEDISLEGVAKSFSISPQHLSRLFKQNIEMGFKQYLISLRLDLAKNLLALTDMSVTAICFEVGFSTLENFVRIFKKNNAMTPLEYREKYKE